MSDSNAPQSTPPGWYADPAGSPQSRWWDGTRWTEHLQAPAAPAYQAQPQAPAYQPQAPAYQAPGYQGAGYAAAAIPQVPAGTPVYNVFIWLITLLPLLAFLVLPLTLSGVDESLRASLADPYSTDVNPYAGLSTSALVAQAVSSLLSFALYAATVVLAYVDHRWLLRHGYVRPFHWAWAFLSSVYPIGRSVVVRRRAGRGIAPMWVTIGVLALSIIVSIVVVVQVFNAVFSTMSTYGSYT